MLNGLTRLMCQISIRRRLGVSFASINLLQIIMASAGIFLAHTIYTDFSSIESRQTKLASLEAVTDRINEITDEGRKRHQSNGQKPHRRNGRAGENL